MQDTYTGLSRDHTITLYNKSDHIISYKWKKYSSREVEEAQSERIEDVFKGVQDIETKRSTKLETLGVVDPVTHDVAYNRIYEDEIKALRSEEFLFSHCAFSFQPMEGELWPHSSCDMLVTFQPPNAINYNVEAFCEVDGIENRIPVSLHGPGRGPSIKLNMATLNISNIFIFGEHTYEIFAANKGHIPGTLKFVPKNLLFGGTMTCKPSTVYLNPDDAKPIVIKFSSSVPGEFVEDVEFVILESSQMIKLTFKGNVMCPTLHFNKKSLQWGTVAIGVSYSHHLILSNDSTVPVAFSIRVLHDGHEDGFTYRNFATYKIKPALPNHPKEFRIHPDKGTVPAFSEINLTVVCR
ncbi:hydrocephalus-inducing protein-like [Periplaneta americana]|uniref:hydrocephalus-inducing protein-like n=1 Tax=Periplaneta americana TaxID=6978 RepID=UPI0037E90E31